MPALLTRTATGPRRVSVSYTARDIGLGGHVPDDGDPADRARQRLRRFRGPIKVHHFRAGGRQTAAYRRANPPPSSHDKGHAAIQVENRARHHMSVPTRVEDVGAESAYGSARHNIT